MKILFPYLVAFICCMHTKPLYGQDLPADMLLVSDRYANLKKFSCDIEVDEYKSPADNIAAHTTYAKVKIDGNKYYCEYSGQELLSNDKCVLVVEKNQRQIIYSQKKGKRQLLMITDTKHFLDSMIATYDTVKYKGIENGAKEYEIIHNKGMISRVVFGIDTATNLISVLTYELNKKMQQSDRKVTVKYLNRSMSPIFSDDQFLESKYIRVGPKGTILAAGKYQNYKVFNNKSAYGN